MARQVRVEIIGDERRLRAAFQGAERHSTRFGATLGRIGGVGLRVFGGLGVAAGGLAAAAGLMGVKTEAGLEQAEIGFTQLLHSGAKARKFIGNLKTFAAKTPFELPGLIDAARGLLGAGESARRIIPDLRDLGDAAGALGLDQERFGRVMVAVTQIMNKGKLSAEELAQITEAGIPVWPLLAKAMGKPVPELQKLISAGKLSADEVLPKLFDQMHKDYGGSMAKQSQTLSGLWSTFMDTINIGLADVIKPFEGELKGGLTAAIKFAGDALKSAADFISGTVIPSIKTLKRWWDSNQEALDALADTLGVAFSGAANDATSASEDLRTSQEKLYDIFSTILEVGLRVAQGWDKLAIAAGTTSKWILNLGIAAATALKAIGFFDPTVRHAADSMISSMRRMRSETETQLDKIRGDAAALQHQIDKLHGKRLRFDAADHVTPVIEGIIQGVRRLHNVVVGFGGVTRPGAPVAFQHGGRPRPGELAIVGEAGPELWIPDRPGTILPAGGGARSAVGMIDYDRLAAALARQPIVVQVDGRALATITRQETYRYQDRNASTGYR